MSGDTMQGAFWGCALVLGGMCLAGAVRAEDTGGGEKSGFITELRGGVMRHDTGAFSDTKEDGVDLNAEILFFDLGWLGDTIDLRPHIGGTVNLAGDTNQAYAGMTATVPIFQWGFFDLSFGGAYHDGETNAGRGDKKDLGCSVLFRESVSLGGYVGAHHSLSLFADHISNANLCDKNEGLETVGMRYGYRF